MRRRDLLALAGSAALCAPGVSAAPAARRLPNFIVILCDDLGFGDLSTSLIDTPHLRRMARQGVQLTDYYAPANLCTPSRASLLTGRYAIRCGLASQVIMQTDPRALPASEVTIAEALKPDYATALIGKWHLGHLNPKWMPIHHGFDEFFGLPYSHDMQPLALYEAAARGSLQEHPVDLFRLQQQFCARAEDFIERNRARPFYLQLSLSSPHLPAYPPEPFAGRSNAGSYGDVVEEIDAITGRILARLRVLGLERDTLVVFTSDNGPWFEGSAGALRARKGGGGFDGASRVPCIVQQPGTLPADRKVGSMVMGIDFLPTFCRMAGKPLPVGVELDGVDIGEVMRRGAPSPHDELLLFDNDEVAGVRTQRWKYVAMDYYRARTLPMAERGYPLLFDVQADPTESYSVAARHPGVLADMQARLAKARARFETLKLRPAAA